MVSQNQIVRLIFGLKIKRLRQKKKLSPQELSAACGLSNSYLNEIEKGKKYPKADKIMSLAEALSVPYDELVSLKLSKKLEPISELLNSHIMKEFPLEMFGIEPGKLVEMIANAPVKMSAFISTIMEIARNYEMRQEHFYLASLRSYQEMHENYFEELEEAASAFLKEHKIKWSAPFDRKHLYDILEQKYNYTIDKTQLKENSNLQLLRSVYLKDKHKLLINDDLAEFQKGFLLGRELAYNYLDLEERPLTTPPYKANSFEEVLNNFKASYFGGALLLNKDELIGDIHALFDAERWSEKKLLQLLNKYEASPEMFLHRFTNLLAKFFGIKNLFFLRFSHSEKSKKFTLTKELHLSHQHNPHGNELNEHYCRRWLSLDIIYQLKARMQQKDMQSIAGVQISKYWGTNNEYLCISFARPNHRTSDEQVSVTIGFQINENLRKKIKFLADPQIATKWVNETCERCPIKDCEERAAKPHIVRDEKQVETIEEALKLLN